MVALETYWQLDLLVLLGGSCEWMLGIVSCLGMAAAPAILRIRMAARR